MPGSEAHGFKTSKPKAFPCRCPRRRYPSGLRSSILSFPPIMAQPEGSYHVPSAAATCGSHGYGARRAPAWLWLHLLVVPLDPTEPDDFSRWIRHPCDDDWCNYAKHTYVRGTRPPPRSCPASKGSRYVLRYTLPNRRDRVIDRRQPRALDPATAGPSKSTRTAYR